MSHLERTSRRTSFFELKDGNKTVIDPAIKEQWIAKFGPEDKELVYGIRYPQNWVERENEKLASLQAEKMELEKKLKTRLEEPEEPGLIDESLLTLEERVYLTEIRDKINILNIEANLVLDQIKIYKLLKDQKNESKEIISKLVAQLTRKLF